MEPAVIFARCSVSYSGRASSVLAVENHLIIIKSDGTILIHGDNLVKPKNYMGPKATITELENKIIAKKKNEEINIELHEIMSRMPLSGWSSKNIILKGSEFEIRDYLADNINRYLDIQVHDFYKEFKTSVGDVDLIVTDHCENWHVFEVKRGKASLSAVSQLNRYVESLGRPGVQGYIAAASITANASAYLESLGYKFIKIDVEQFVKEQACKAIS